MDNIKQLSQQIKAAVKLHNSQQVYIDQLSQQRNDLLWKIIVNENVLGSVKWVARAVLSCGLVLEAESLTLSDEHYDVLCTESFSDTNHFDIHFGNTCITITIHNTNDVEQFLDEHDIKFQSFAFTGDAAAYRDAIALLDRLQERTK